MKGWCALTVILTIISSCSSLVLLEPAETLPKGRNRFFVNLFMGSANVDYCGPDSCEPHAEWTSALGGVQFGWRRGISESSEFHLKGGYSYPLGGAISLGMKFSQSKHLALGFGIEGGFPMLVDFYIYPIFTAGREPVYFSFSPRFVISPNYYFIGGNSGFIVGEKVGMGIEFFVYKFLDFSCEDCDMNGIPNVLGIATGIYF